MTRPLILFGAFDRHNVGDLLFPHVCAALLPARAPVFAGLAARDLRQHGGHRVEALRAVAARMQGRPADLLHVGGELLSCSAFEAAVMLLPEKEAQLAMAGPPRVLKPPGSADLLPYLATPELFSGVRIAYNAIGGVDFDRLDAALQAEAEHKLRQAGWLAVRERSTQVALARCGIRSDLLPDSVSLVAELFGERIGQHGRRGEPAAVAASFPEGYLALQFSADFSDEAMLAALAAQLEKFAADHRRGIVLFRAGAAPWHDALAPYHQLAARLPVPVHVFCSLDIWDICALIAASRAYCGTSLHGRIIAMAYGLPRVNLGKAGGSGKLSAYAATWDDDQPPVVPVDEAADALDAAMAAPPARRQEQARWLAACYREGFKRLAAALDAPT